MRSGSPRAEKKKIETRRTRRRSAQLGRALRAAPARRVSREAANRKGKTRKVRMCVAGLKGCPAVDIFSGAKRYLFPSCALRAYDEFSRLIFSVRGFARVLLSLTCRRRFAVGPSVLVFFVFQSSFFPRAEAFPPSSPSQPATGRIGSSRLGGAGEWVVFRASGLVLAGFRDSESGCS